MPPKTPIAEKCDLEKRKHGPIRLEYLTCKTAVCLCRKINVLLGAPELFFRHVTSDLSLLSFSFVLPVE